MATKKDFTIGQKVWIRQENRREKDSLIETEIIKVGNKYVTTERGKQFKIETLIENTEYTPRKLYLSDQEFYEEQELEENISDIRIAFGYGSPRKFTADQTRRILAIMNEGKEQD